MSENIRIRKVTVELLRSGPSHNQLLSPLTLYLGICDEAEAGIVTLPFEHHTFLRRMSAMRYDDDAKAEDRLPELRAMGVEMAKVLGSIPRLPGSLSGDTGGRDTLVHLSLVLSASELALLPFELAKMPIGPTTWTESWMALQSRVPVVITRRTRNVAPRDFPWLKNPRVLFVAANPDPKAPDSVPFAEHRRAMIAAVRPFLFPVDRESKLSNGGRREAFGERLTILQQPRIDELRAECAHHRYTHIHVLAHGATDVSQGDRSFGLYLHPRDGVISGERLASAITCMVGGNIHRPDVVTLATCDSGNSSEAVVAPGASIAHVLHQAGVPLVLASQFPLSKAGSVLVVREFYSGLLWGEHPWVLMHRVRTGLHGTMKTGDHDWASLVVYEALDLDIFKLDQARYTQCHQAMLAAWMDDDGVEDSLPEDDTPALDESLMAGDWKADVVIPRLPVHSKFFGMRALALRADGRLQNAIDTLHAVDKKHKRIDSVGEFEARVATSCREMEEAIDDYEAAVTGFLVKDGQGMNAPYRSLVALIRLRTVLGRPNPQGIWETAEFWVSTTLRESADTEEKMWAWACMAELWLLKLLDPQDSVRRQADDTARRAAGELARLDRAGESLARHWVMVQIDTYIKFWGDKQFEAALARFGETERRSFRLGETNLVLTARALHDILDRQAARARAEKVPLPMPVALKSKPKGTVKPKAAGKAAMKAPADAAASLAAVKTATPPAATAAAAAAAAKAAFAGRLSAKANAGEAFLNIQMLPARHGDALWIEYGRGNATPARVLVDCGPAGTYPLLRKKIEALAPAERHFELFILSHIDDDHIGGAIKLLKDVRTLGLSFGDVWFNGWRHLSDQLNAKQGEAFSALILDKKLPWNQLMNEGDAILREADELPEFVLPGGLTLTLLSPTPERLAALARSWSKEITALGGTPGEIETGRRFLGRVPSASEDVVELAAERFESDSTAANGSSIAVLAEFGGKAVLLGGDAHAPVLQQAVELLCAQRQIKTLPLTAFKLPHHGSQNNLSNGLLALLKCKHYLVSSSGARFNHPDRQAIARVIEHGRKTGLASTLHFNYRSPEPLNAVWSKAALKQKYGYAAVYPENTHSADSADNAEDGLWVRL